MSSLIKDPIDCLSGEEVLARIDAINRSCERIFGRGNRAKIAKKLTGKSDITLHQICRNEGEISAFKLGYTENQAYFYSWLGGVIPEARGQHLARALMIAQHRWAKERGYQAITTRTELDNDRMSKINLSAGFFEGETIIKTDGRKLRCFHKALNLQNG